MPIDGNIYYKFCCAGCGHTQYLDNGDPRDMTSMDLIEVVCEVCGRVELLDFDED